MINADMITNSDWLINNSMLTVLDLEYQGFIIEAIRQKFETAIAGGDVKYLYEIIFHYLNTNTLFSEKKMYDEYFNEIKNSESLNMLIKDLKENPEGIGLSILNQARTMYTEVLNKYLELAVNEMSDTDVYYFDIKNIHFYNLSIYAMFNVRPHDMYELWYLSYHMDKKLGSAMTKLAEFKLEENESDPVKKFIDEYNRTNQATPIKSTNFVGVSALTPKDSFKIISLVKDIIMLNKIFYDQYQFNSNVLKDMQQLLHEKNALPFKLHIL